MPLISRKCTTAKLFSRELLRGDEAELVSMARKLMVTG